jgi:hypothetical protein
MRKVIDKSRRVVLALGTRWLRWRGYAPYAAPRMARSLLNDLLHTRGIGLSRKWWAYRHGFLSASIAEYGLTTDNYRGYVPDLDYSRWFPINNGYRKWIDDKLTIRHVLAPFVKHLPRSTRILC